MKSVFKLGDLNGIVQSAIANNHRSNDKAIMQWEVECAKVKEHNAAIKLEAEKVFNQYGKEGILKLCTEEVEMSYTKKGFFFDKEVKYSDTVIFNSKVPAPLHISKVYYCHDSNMKVVLCKFEIETHHRMAFEVFKSTETYEIYYITKRVPELYCNCGDTDSGLVALQDKVDYLLKSGATEVILDDNEIQLLTKWS
jgi:hypothetical protein